MGTLKVNGTIWSQHPSESQIGVNFNNQTLQLYNNSSFRGLYDTAFGSVIKIENGTGVMEFAGNSYSATILKLYQTGGSATGVGDWEPSSDSRFSHFHTVYKQKWTNSNLNNDTGDLVLTLRNGNTSGTEMCMFIDGDYYAMGFYKVLNELNYSNYALPLTGGTISGTIWSNHVYPKTTMSYNFGSADYEYNATFSRTVFWNLLKMSMMIFI